MPDLYDEDGDVLQEVHDFTGRFIIDPSEAAHVAHTLWIGHTYFMDDWDSTPRIAFLSPEPGSGKSRALEVTEPLVNRPVHAVNTTPAYLFRKVSDPDGIPVILYDEIDTVFGPKAKDNEDMRGMLNAGHRKGAMAGRCVVKGRKRHDRRVTGLLCGSAGRAEPPTGHHLYPIGHYPDAQACTQRKDGALAEPDTQT